MNLASEEMHRPLRVRVRLDFRGVGKPGRFLFGGKPSDKIAEELREQQVAIFRNVPIQGIQVEEIDVSSEVYLVHDEVINAEVAYAPVVLQIRAETLEDVVKFIARDDFRKIEIIDPPNLALTRYDVERLLFRVAEEMRVYRSLLERKYNSR
ncbi:hypothetical protein Desca_2027 [Desulfotomaculum nigrificans CO-1-SRB]|uniref:Uncharacterized protein n=1 Tax=Desulfotomaculum nigrificans (strain DSM 14880 / VKM B-2319 / CO-1-SRB) TaxID=868595 RepID=F6B994_DESCC|nr:hypothetical protein [Desulfotomaculum nigrificans]AEF94866.1 hypothetical protein Desca_2027 [Desulfotomaculum nigrificans CO-1-SRB]